MSAPAPAWYADPYDASRVRWWNGAAWTTAVRPRPSETTADPAPASPAPAPTPAVTPTPAAPEPTIAPVLAPVAVATPTIDTSRLSPLPAETEPAPAPQPSSFSAPSIGAARLPPLVAPTPTAPPEPPAPLPTARREGGVRPLFLIAGLLACVLLIGLIAYGAGLIGGGDSSASGVSTPGGTTIEGDGYSFGVPADWEQTSVPEALPRAVSTVVDGPDDLVAFVMRTDQSAVMPDDPDVQARYLDLMVQTEQSALSQAQVLGSVPTTLDGSPAQLVTMQGVDASGATIQAYVVASVHDGRLYMLFLGGPGESASAAKGEFDEMIASFRFD